VSTSAANVEAICIHDSDLSINHLPMSFSTVPAALRIDYTCMTYARHRYRCGGFSTVR